MSRKRKRKGGTYLFPVERQQCSEECCVDETPLLFIPLINHHRASRVLCVGAHLDSSKNPRRWSRPVSLSCIPTFVYYHFYFSGFYSYLFCARVPLPCRPPLLQESQELVLHFFHFTSPLVPSSSFYFFTSHHVILFVSLGS